MKKELIFIGGLVMFIAVMRFLPHPWNITPIGALALFSGAYISRNIALLIPICALILGDMAGGFYAPVVMLFVYAGFAASTLIGKFMLFRKLSVHRLGFAVISSAVMFYLLSNFGMWLHAYPTTVDGIVLCYLNGLPYLAKSLAGDAVYSILLFGGYELIRHVFSENKPVVNVS